MRLALPLGPNDFAVAPMPRLSCSSLRRHVRAYPCAAVVWALRKGTQVEFQNQCLANNQRILPGIPPRLETRVFNRSPEDSQLDLRKNTTVYNFDTITVDGKPEVQFKYLKILVGERGFEPPTPWSRTSPLRLTNFAKEINRLPSGDLACIMPHMGSCVMKYAAFVEKNLPSLPQRPQKP